MDNWSPTVGWKPQTLGTVVATFRVLWSLTRKERTLLGSLAVAVQFKLSVATSGVGSHVAEDRIELCKPTLPNRRVRQGSGWPNKHWKAAAERDVSRQ